MRIAFRGLHRLSLLSLCVGGLWACGDPQSNGGTSGASSTQPHELSSSTAPDSSNTSAPKPSPGWGDMAAFGKRLNEFSGEMSTPVIAVNQRGEAIAAWTTMNKDSDPIKPHLHAALYRDHAWQPAFLVTQDPAQEPVVAINEAGDFAITYLRVAHEANEVVNSDERWVIRAPQGQLQSAERVGPAAPTTGIEGLYGHEAALHLDAKGNVLLVFKQSGLHEGLFVSYHADAGWSAPVRIDTRIPSHVHTFDLAGNDVGQAVLVWLDIYNKNDPKDKEATGVNLKAKIFDAGTAGAELALGDGQDPSFGGIAVPRVRMDAQGNATVLYLEGREGQGRGLRTRRYDRVAKTWSPPEILVEAKTSFHPRTALAMNAQGDAAVAWSLEVAPEKTGARMSYRGHDQAQWGTPLDVVVHDSSIDWGPFVTMAGPGKAWVGFEQSKSNHETSFHVRAYASDTGLGEVSTPLAGSKFALEGSADGTVFAISRRTVIGQNPLGYFSVPTASVYTP